jgi:hypothetical protein
MSAGSTTEGMCRSERTNPPMKALAAEPQIFEFCFPKQDTLLKVEVWDDAVTIRATRNTFTAQRKAAFVHELAAEGFIAGDYQWCSDAGAESPCSGVHWLVDTTWLRQDEATAVRTRRTLLRLLAPVAVFLTVFVALASGAPQRFSRPNELIGPRGQHYISSPEAR